MDSLSHTHALAHTLTPFHIKVVRGHVSPNNPNRTKLALLKVIASAIRQEKKVKGTCRREKQASV